MFGMFLRILSETTKVGDLPAGEGIGAVLGAALNGLLALALIFGVLIVMDQVRKKKEKGNPTDSTPAPKEKEKGEGEE